VIVEAVRVIVETVRVIVEAVRVSVDCRGCEQGWAKLVLIALERYSVALKRLNFNLR
jgi:hypothetical protein